MAVISEKILGTRSYAGYREHFAVVGDNVIITNGHENNKIYSLANDSFQDCGITAPTTANFDTTEVTNNGAGVVNGTVRYRIRWKDSNTGTLSLGSASVEHTPVNNTVRLTLADSAHARATHWIIERTLSNGTVYYAVNVDSDNPHGTLVGTTTYDDNLSDETLGARHAYNENQGVLAPYKWCFVNQGRVFFGGRKVHTVSADMTNGSASVSSGTGFNSNQVDYQLRVPGDADGAVYKVQSVGGATALTLASNYAGTTANKTVQISGPAGKVAWSESDSPEHGGTEEVGALSNEAFINDDGADPTSGVGLGMMGVIYATLNGLYLHRYTLNPSPIEGDGRLVKLPTTRGAVCFRAMRYIEGSVYGIDQRGIWRWTPGADSVPQEIGSGISNDWSSNAINWSTQDNFHIGFDPTEGTILFYICMTGETHPKSAYIYDLKRQVWRGKKPRGNGTTASIELPFTDLSVRHCFVNQALSDAASVGSYYWMDGIGQAGGAIEANNTNLVGTPTSGTANTMTSTGAGFDTTVGLEGVPCINRYWDSVNSVWVDEVRVISANTGTQITVTSNWGVNPSTTSRYIVGPMAAEYRTGRLGGRYGAIKKKFKFIKFWCKYQSDCIPFRVYGHINGSDLKAWTHAQDNGGEDGIDMEINEQHTVVDPRFANHVYTVSLHDIDAFDMRLVIESDWPGEPWEIYAMKVCYLLEESYKGASK